MYRHWKTLSLYGPQDEYNFSCNIDVLKLCTSYTADSGCEGTAVRYRQCGSLNAVRPIAEWRYRFTVHAQVHCKFYTAHRAVLLYSTGTEVL